MTVIAFLIVGVAIVFGATGNSEAGIHTFIQNGEKTSSAGSVRIIWCLCQLQHSHLEELRL